MPIIDKNSWENWADVNTDSHGQTCVLVAERIMAMLDSEFFINSHEMFSRVEKEIAKRINKVMANSVAQVLLRCHSRGAEFYSKWTDLSESANQPLLSKRKLNLVA